jgi:hypothetical protein
MRETRNAYLIVIGKLVGEKEFLLGGLDMYQKINITMDIMLDGVECIHLVHA